MTGDSLQADDIETLPALQAECTYWSDYWVCVVNVKDSKKEDKEKAERLKQQILDLSGIKKHYNGDTYFFELNGCFWIPTNAGDLQTAEDYLELFHDKELKELEDFSRFREWAEYKQLKKEKDDAITTLKTRNEEKRILQAKLDQIVKEYNARWQHILKLQAKIKELE